MACASALWRAGKQPDGNKAVPTFSSESLVMKTLIRRALRSFDLDIVRIGSRPSVIDFLFDRKIDLVLDVGANEGQFASSLRQHNYTGRIMSFEPIASVFEKLAISARNDPKWNIYNVALGAKAERTDIHVSVHSTFSSLRPLTEAATKHEQSAAVDHIEQIEIRTLDDVLPNPSGNILLKIDTQGFEQEVLQGARATLPALRGALMELPIVQFYHGNWSIQEALGFMAQAGFVPAQIHPVNYHSQDKFSVVEVDCLFRRLDPRLDGPGAPR